MAEGNKDKRNDGLGQWILPIAMLFIFPPVGVLLIVLKLVGMLDGRRTLQKQHPYDLQQQWVQGEVNRGMKSVFQNGYDLQWQEEMARRQRPGREERGRDRKKASGEPKHKDNLPSGRVLILVGGILTAIFGLSSMAVVMENLMWLPDMWSYFLEEAIPVLCFFGGSLATLLYGFRQRKKGRKYRKYLSMIGKRERINLSILAETMGVPMKETCDDLQDMLDRGCLPTGYVDIAHDRLVLSDEGVEEWEAPPAPDAAPSDSVEQDETILRQIRAVNDRIANLEMSCKIDEIETITRKIFGCLKNDPKKSGQLRGFLNYYLPTTLKILHTYAQLEEQGIEGENITATKERIEGMIDKVVEGFRKQLDKLFQNDALDITTDVAVLEKMLSKDGLSQGEGLQLGG